MNHAHTRVYAVVIKLQPFAQYAEGAPVTNPLFDAIDRLTRPYEMQERVYRNRVDEDAAEACAPRTAMDALEARYGITVLGRMA